MLVFQVLFLHVVIAIQPFNPLLGLQLMRESKPHRPKLVIGQQADPMATGAQRQCVAIGRFLAEPSRPKMSRFNVPRLAASDAGQSANES